MITREYKLINGQIIIAYISDSGKIEIDKDSLDTMVNSWNEGYAIGFMNGVDDTTRRAYKSIGLAEMFIKNFIDYVFKEEREITLSSEYGFREFLEDMLEEYKNLATKEGNG